MAYLFIFEAASLYYEINLMNACCTSDRAASKIKVNIKETFMRNEGFLQVFMWFYVVNGLQSENKRLIAWEI